MPDTKAHIDELRSRIASLNKTAQLLNILERYDLNENQLFTLRLIDNRIHEAEALIESAVGTAGL